MTPTVESSRCELLLILSIALVVGMVAAFASTIVGISTRTVVLSAAVIAAAAWLTTTLQTAPNEPDTSAGEREELSLAGYACCRAC